MISLHKFGLTNTESKIYLEITKLGETTIGPIIKITELHRGTVYNSINNLIKKGFLSFVDKEGIRYYKTSGEGIFNSIIKSKGQELEREKKEIENFIDRLNNIKENKEEQEVSVFYGIESFKTLFIEIYEYCKKNNLEYLVIGRGGEILDVVGEGFTNTHKN